MPIGILRARTHAFLAILAVSALLATVVRFPAVADPLPSEHALEEAESRATELETLVSEAESELVAIERDLAELERELAAAQEELEAATSLFTAADRAATDATDRYDAARRALAEAEAELEGRQETLGELARDTFMYGLPVSSPVIAVLGSAQGADDEKLADRLHYLQRGIGVRAAAIEESEALSIEVEHLTLRATAEAEEAKAAREVAEAARDDAARLHTRVADLTSETSDKLERSAHLVAVLEAEQEEVATRVRTLEQRVAEEKAERERREREERERRERERQERERREREAREQRDREAREQRDREAGEQREREAREQRDRDAREQREREAREQREREAREREERERREREEANQRASASGSSSSRSSSSGGSSSGGSSSGGSSSGGSSSGGSSSGGSSSGGSSGGSGSTSIRPGPSPNLVTVGGITVAASIGSQLQALLDHARRDGIVLGGHGYRSPEVTARLRIANGCPDVYDSPASACRVPTARPGTSEHEKGLAVDFTWQGQTICFPRPGSQCRGNAAFNWLKANAGKYGFKNLPSEAWHWSTTGR